MGGGFYSKYDQSFQKKDWEEIDQDYYSQYVIVKNKITGQLLDRYQVHCANEKEYEKYMVSVNFRRNQENIIRIIHYEPKIIKQFCGSCYILYVYLQHCKSRLSEYEDIPSPDYLYCAMAMVNGFEKLYKKIGRFYVSSNSVMIDEMGRIRVWINENFSENQAEDIRQITGSREERNEEYEMVNDIITIILENIDEENEEYKVKFKEFYQEKRVVFNEKIGFVQCRNIINEFCRINNIEIPNIFHAVLNLYEDQKIKTLKKQQVDNKQFDNHLMVDGRKGEQITNINGEHAGQNYGNRVVGPHGNQPAGSEPFMRGTSLPLAIQPGRSHVVLETPSFINNRNTAPIYLPSSHSGLRVTTPISPLPVTGPPSPSHNMINYPLTSSIQLANVTHNFGCKPQVISSNSRVAPPLVLNSFIPIKSNTMNNNTINSNIINNKIINNNIINNSTVNNNTLKQSNQQRIPMKTLNEKKIIISSSCPLTLTKNKLDNNNNNKNNKQIIKYNNKYNEKKKIQLCQQQLQIQKNFILKESNNLNNNDQHIIQSNIIKQLSELHKIQQKQKFKQKQIFIQSINDKNQFYYHNQLNKQQCQISNQQSSINRFDSPIYYQNLSSARSSVQNDNHFLQAQQKVIFNSQQQPKNTFSQPSFNPIPSKQFPIQYNNRFTPQVSKQVPQQTQIQNLVKRGGQNLANNENLSTSKINRQFYYTLHDQVQLDPQIVNDLSLYKQS